MMQYANRYRHTHENIRAALDKACIYSRQNSRYQDALDKLERHLNVEPGGVQNRSKILF